MNVMMGRRWIGAVLMGTLASIGAGKGMAQAPQQPMRQAQNKEGRPPELAAATVMLGMPKDRVDALLGPVRSTWTIHCLQREMATYADGTKAIFVNNLLVSANPVGMPLDALAHGHVLERHNRQVYFEPGILCGNPGVGPIADVKNQVESSFWMGPPSHVLPPPYISLLPPPQPDHYLFPHLRHR